MPPDPTLEPEELRALSSLGPWAQWVVAHHPNTPPDLLAEMAASPDPQLRRFVAQHPNLPESGGRKIGGG